ncbi:replication initiation protein [Belnapia sp. T18]|uniref:Replication initiation protein n=1 Tax=Belnapia arida TaxID=2804533 RepID=A0ABS1UA40_9PROT|nr:replication initiation protein [Belnapia arida]MBL6080784.1 replication initiation protein [Belnapia arida]
MRRSLDYPLRRKVHYSVQRSTSQTHAVPDPGPHAEEKPDPPEADKDQSARVEAETAKTILPHSEALDANVEAQTSKPASAAPKEAKPKPTAEMIALFTDAARERRRSTEACVKLRMEVGFQWWGGFFAESKTYFRPEFCYRGLVSSEHPILQLFASKVPKVRRLYVGDHKGEAYRSDSKLLALDAAYVEDNKRVCGVLRIEVDAILAWDDIADACRTAGVPLPNLVVGWEDNDGRVHHPHLFWLLHDSVPMEGERCARFSALYRGVLRGLTKALLPLGADPGGLLNSHRHKNPLSPMWQRRILAEQPYDLGVLRQHVDINVRMDALRELAAAQQRSPTLSPEHPDPLIAAGSNRLFAHLTSWARQEVWPHKAAGRDEQEFSARVAAEAMRLADSLSGDGRRAEKKALVTAAKVARWTWHVYKARAPKPVTSNPVDLAERHGAGGRMTAESRKARSEGLIVAAATRLAKELGRTPTQAAVLAAVQNEGIVSERTVRRHWDAVRSAMANGAESEPANNRTDAVPHVKKGHLNSAETENPSLASLLPVTHDLEMVPTPCREATAVQVELPALAMADVVTHSEPVVPDIRERIPLGAAVAVVDPSSMVPSPFPAVASVGANPSVLAIADSPDVVPPKAPVTSGVRTEILYGASMVDSTSVATSLCSTTSDVRAGISSGPDMVNSLSVVPDPRPAVSQMRVETLAVAAEMESSAVVFACRPALPNPSKEHCLLPVGDRRDMVNHSCLTEVPGWEEMFPIPW